MSITDLIDRLTELAVEAGDDETTVRLVQQPSWPMEYRLGEPVLVDGVIYIPEAGQVGYLSGDVAAELGWS